VYKWGCKRKKHACRSNDVFGDFDMNGSKLELILEKLGTKVLISSNWYTMGVNEGFLRIGHWILGFHKSVCQDQLSKTINFLGRDCTTVPFQLQVSNSPIALVPNYIHTWSEALVKVIGTKNQSARRKKKYHFFQHKLHYTTLRYHLWFGGCKPANNSLNYGMTLPLF
jgi:hypothetical protein